MNWDCIASIQDVKRDFACLEEKVKRYGKAVIFSENRPAYIVQPFNLALAEEQFAVQKEIQALLKGIGMRVFVTYYMNFKNNDDPFSFLSKEGFSDHSIRSRMSKARAIFQNNRQKDALAAIISANRADAETKKLAGIILQKENEQQGEKRNV